MQLIRDRKAAIEACVANGDLTAAGGQAQYRAYVEDLMYRRGAPERIEAPERSPHLRVVPDPDAT